MTTKTTTGTTTGQPIIGPAGIDCCPCRRDSPARNPTEVPTENLSGELVRSAPPYRRRDGAVFTSADLAGSDLLHHRELDDLGWLLGLLEDWLLHCGDDIRRDLADFTDRHTADDLIAELGTHTIKLHRLTG